MSVPSHRPATPGRTIQARTLEEELLWGDLGACLAHWQPGPGVWPFVAPLAPVALGSLAIACGLPVAETCGAAAVGLVFGLFARRDLARSPVVVHERGMRIARDREVRWWTVRSLEERVRRDAEGRVTATVLRVWFSDGRDALDSIELSESGAGAPEGPIAAARRMAEPWVRRNRRVSAR